MDADALDDEVDEWVREGIISDEQAEAILARYEGGADEPRRSRAVLALSLVGSALVFVGVTLFLATNWADLPLLARAVVLVTAPGLAYAGGALAYDRTAARIGHALCLLGAVLAGPSIFLFDDLFALGLHDAWLLLAWTAIALPTGHALASRPGTGLGLFVLLVLVGNLAEPTDPAPPVGLVGVALFAIGCVGSHARSFPGTPAGSHTVGGAGGSGAGADPVAWTYRVGGAAVALAALLLLTTHEGRFFRFEFEASAMLVAGLLGAAGGAGWLSIASRRAASGWALVAIGAIAGSAAVASMAPDALPDLLAFVGTHLALLAALLATGYLGYRTRSRSLVDLAALGGLLQTLAFVSATVVDALSGAVALVVAGLVLLAVGVGLERGRRSVLERL